MGAFIWHQWAHFVAITSSVYTIWAGFWGLVYRKFFWDFVNGNLRNPGGLQAANSDMIFVQIIVLVPIVQILAMIIGITILTLELPLLSRLKTMSIYRSWVVRIILLAVQAFFAIMFYQGTNGALYSVVAMIGYIMAQVRGEIAPEARDNKGRGGKA